jgi:hypothetical protein
MPPSAARTLRAFIPPETGSLNTSFTKQNPCPIKQGDEMNKNFRNYSPFAAHFRGHLCNSVMSGTYPPSGLHYFRFCDKKLNRELPIWWWVQITESSSFPFRNISDVVLTRTSLGSYSSIWKISVPYRLLHSANDICQEWCMVSSHEVFPFT